VEDFAFLGCSLCKITVTFTPGLISASRRLRIVRIVPIRVQTAAPSLDQSALYPLLDRLAKPMFARQQIGEVCQISSVMWGIKGWSSFRILLIHKREFAEPPAAMG